jgi:hypothetical protein
MLAGGKAAGGVWKKFSDFDRNVITWRRLRIEHWLGCLFLVGQKFEWVK